MHVLGFPLEFWATRTNTALQKSNIIIELLPHAHESTFIRMRFIFALAIQALVCLVAFQAQLIYPDEWLVLQRREDEKHRQLQHTVRQTLPQNIGYSQQPPTKPTQIPCPETLGLKSKVIIANVTRLGSPKNAAALSKNETFADFLPPKWKNHVSI